MTLPAPTVLDCEQITVGWGGRQVIANLHRTSRRVLRIEVRPSGDVVVFAPSGASLAAIQDRVKKKCAWVFREIDRIGTRPSATPDRHFISGETHLLLGKQYRLAIEQGSRLAAPHREQTSRLCQSGTGVSGPYRRAISGGSALVPPSATRSVALAGST
jgi:predicted metal-dependent hydrolase